MKYRFTRMAASAVLSAAISVCLSLAAGSGIASASDASSSLLASAAPYSVRMMNSEMLRNPQAVWLDGRQGKLKWNYTTGLELLSFLDVAERYGLDYPVDYVRDWADTMADNSGSIVTYKKENYNLDHICPGRIYYRLYYDTGDKKYRRVLRTLREQLDSQPRTSEGVFWHKQVYPHQVWLDGLYMASPFMAQYGAEFTRPEWIDEAVKQFRLCHQYTYDAATGLYYHAWDESKSQRWANPETGHSPNFWGRSIGWWFMALVDALDYIPERHEGYADLVAYIRGLAEVLPKYQDKDGLWYQVLDQPERKGNFPEASVTAQCMYAYAKAVNKGYIDVRYKEVAEKAFEGLKNKLIVENPDGTLTLTRCCQVGGLGGNPYRDGSFEYYIGEKMRDNDAKATGPFIMGCLELGK